MKKFFAIVVMSVMALTSVSAQHKDMVRSHTSLHHGQVRHEMNIDILGKKVAEELQLEEKTAEKFIPIYQSYCEEKQKIAKKYGKLHKPNNKMLMSDSDVAQANKDNLARQRAMLEVEETYYKKFTKVISERQYNVLMHNNKKRHGMRGVQGHHFQRPDSSTHKFQPLARPMKPRAEMKAQDAV